LRGRSVSTLKRLKRVAGPWILLSLLGFLWWNLDRQLRITGRLDRTIGPAAVVRLARQHRLAWRLGI